MHPSVLAVKSGDFAEVQLAVLDQFGALHPFDSFPGQQPTTALIPSEAADLAPPSVQGIPLYQQISVLRI